MSRVLVTGALGFQGAHLMSALVRAGHYVTALNTPSSRARAREADLATYPSCLVWGSVTDAALMRRVVRNQDVIIHLAAMTNPDESLIRPHEAVDTNVIGTRVLLDTIRDEQRNGNALALILASSCEVYGSLPANAMGQFEDYSAFEPRTPYAASKAAADRLAYAYAMAYGLSVVILRPCNIYGPFQRSGVHGGVIPNFVMAALTHAPLIVRGDGSQSREFMYVDDLVAGYLCALSALRDATSPIPGTTFNLGTLECVSVKHIAERIIDKLGGHVEYRDARPGDVSRFLLSSDKARKTLGWVPRVRFDDGLQRYIDWAKEHTVNVSASDT